MKRVVIAGGSGFIGHTLVPGFHGAGYEVVVLSRKGHAMPGARVATWDGKTASEAWVNEVDGAYAVLNYCGASLVRPWTPRNRRLVRESRIEPTHLIGAAI